MKSIGAALVLAGFDSVKPSALEMFRAQVEECEGCQDGGIKAIWLTDT